MKTKHFILPLLIAAAMITSCKKETRDKLKKAKQDVSNVTSVIGNVKEAQEDALKLKEMTPLTNDELKSWLPENINGMTRTGFKVGKAGYIDISSIEGTFKTEATDDKKELKVEVFDGAGPTGSMFMMSVNMVTNMDVEEEDENKHIKTVKKNGIKAHQTYYKKRNDTKIQFLYEKRLGVIVTANDMDVDETWDAIKKLNLNKLL